jgi:delta8-fatty-acid desaturase
MHGEVYDLTDWLPHHPGGEGVLLSFAGQDITDAFLAFHPPGTGASMLPSLKVGELSDYAPSELSLDYRSAIAELQSSGLFSVRLSPYLPLALSLAALLLLCVVSVVCCHGTLLHMAAAAGLGLFWSQTSFVMHDYGHSPFLRNPNLDRKLKILLACVLTGLSPSWWKRSHNAHHVSTNNLSHDPDVQFIPFFAISSRFFSSLYSHYHGRAMAFGKLSQLLVSHQHLTFYPIMLIARLNLLLQAFVFFLGSGDYKGKRSEVCGILGFWLWLSALLWSLPSAPERLGFLLVSCAVTSIQHLQFCLNHFPCEVSDGMPDGAEFLATQVKGTLNIECHRSMDWFHGGLQFQLEHHLFPRLPRHNLRRVSAMARALCRRHGLPYVSVGFWRANAMLFHTLRQAAMEARAWKSSSSSSCPEEVALPPPKNLAWELINAQG